MVQNVDGSTTLHLETRFVCQGEEGRTYLAGRIEGCTSRASEARRNAERTYHDLVDLFVLLHDIFIWACIPPAMGSEI